LLAHARLQTQHTPTATMTCYFANRFVPRHSFYAPARTCYPCGLSPCASPLFLIAAFFFLPTLLRLLFFGLGFMLLNVAPFLLVAWLFHCFTDGTYCGAMRTWCKPQTVAAGDKKKGGTTTPTQEREQRTSEQEMPESSTVYDNLYTPSVQFDDDKIRVTFTVPGLQARDIDLRMIDDHVLRVTGKTTKGTEVYRVAQSVKLPSAKVDTMMATLEDGVLTVEVQRKVRRVTIPVKASVSSQASVLRSNLSSDPVMPKQEDEWEAVVAKDGSGDVNTAPGAD